MSETDAIKIDNDGTEEKKGGDHGNGSDYESAEESKEEEATSIHENNEEISIGRRRDVASDDEDTITEPVEPVESAKEANETKESNNTETVEIHAVADETSVTESSSVDGTVPVEGAKLTEDISPQSDPVAVTLEKLETLTVRDSIAVDESAVASDKLLETTMKIQQESPVKESVKIESDRPPEEDKEMIVKEEISVKPVTNGNIADEIPQSEDESEDQSGEEEEEELPPPVAAVADIDEDRKNPAFIPKRGGFYQHDLRVFDEAPKVPPKESSKLLWVEKQNKWRHDLFTEEDQAPKSRRELVNVYGYDIREDEKAPRATRLRKYSRNTGQKPRYDRERKLSDGAEEGRAKSAKGFQYRRANTEEISSEDVDTRRRGRSPEHEEKEIKSSMKESEFPPLNAKSSEKVNNAKSPSAQSRNSEERRKNDSQPRYVPHQDYRDGQSNQRSFGSNRREAPRYDQQRSYNNDRVDDRGDYGNSRGKPRSYQQSRYDRYENETQPGYSRGGPHYESDSGRNQGGYRGEENSRRRNDRWGHQPHRDDYQSQRSYNNSRPDDYDRGDNRRHNENQQYERRGNPPFRGGGGRQSDRLYEDHRSENRQETRGRGRGSYSNGPFPSMEFRRRNHESDRERYSDTREDSREPADYSNRRRGNQNYDDQPNEVFAIPRSKQSGYSNKRQSPTRIPNGQPSNPPPNWRQELPPRFKQQKDGKGEDTEERPDTRTSDGGGRNKRTPSPPAAQGEEGVKGDKGKPKRYSAARKTQTQGGYQQTSEAAETHPYSKENRTESRQNDAGGQESQAAERANYYEPYETEPLQFDPSLMSGAQPLAPNNSGYQYMRSQQPPPFIQEPYYVPPMNQYPPTHLPYNGPQANAFLPTATPGVQMAMPPYPQSQEIMYSQAGNVDYYAPQQADSVGPVYYDQLQQQQQRGPGVNYHPTRQNAALSIQSPPENRRQNRLN